MKWIYATRGSSGATSLAKAVDAKRAKNRERFLRWVRPADLVIGWGQSLPPGLPEGVKVLNPKHVGNKLKELRLLEEAGVSVVPFMKRIPGAQLPAGEWLPRDPHHQEARDLLERPERVTYLTKKLNLVREFRIHIFKGLSIRAGMKVPRLTYEGQPHPWIRSWRTGWMIDYGQGREFLQQAYREEAKKAVKALGYDFGAVDIGVTPEGEVIVLEVNSAPGLEGNTITAYAKRFLEEANA